MFKIKKYTLFDNLLSLVIGLLFGFLIIILRISFQFLLQPQKIVIQPVIITIEKIPKKENYISEEIEEIEPLEFFIEQDAELARIMEEKMLLTKLVHAEAGNQNLLGKQLVVDVVLNRVDDDRFPNTIEEVIFQSNQFSVITSGAFDRAENEIVNTDWEAVDLEYGAEKRVNNGILYFSTSPCNGKDHFKYGDHWFGY